MQRQQRRTAGHFGMRAASLTAVLGMMSLGCALLSGVADPRAAGSRYDRWEAVIARPRSSVYDVAVRTLTDSGYVLAQTNSGVSAISTADRKVRRAERSAGKDATIPVSDYPVRLSLVLSPIGADSTRLSITGQYRSNNRNVDARSDDWHFVRGIGEGIITRLR